MGIDGGMVNIWSAPWPSHTNLAAFARWDSKNPCSARPPRHHIGCGACNAIGRILVIMCRS